MVAQLVNERQTMSNTFIKDHIQHHLKQQEDLENLRDLDADGVLLDIKSNLEWGVKQCSEMAELKPADQDQINPEQVFEMFKELNFTIYQIKVLAEMVGCKISITYEYENEIGAKNEEVPTHGFETCEQ